MLFICPSLLTNPRGAAVLPGAACSITPVPLKDGTIFLKYANPSPLPATWMANGAATCPDCFLDGEAFLLENGLKAWTVSSQPTALL